jgi:hypothetical protein
MMEIMRRSMAGRSVLAILMVGSYNRDYAYIHARPVRISYTNGSHSMIEITRRSMPGQFVFAILMIVLYD